MATWRARLGMGLLVVGLGSHVTEGHAGAATQDPVAATSGVRGVGTDVQALIARGSERSATFRTLLTSIERAGWTVRVVRGRCPSRDILACLPHDIASSGGRVLARVILDDRRRSAPEEQIAVLAHELQHVVEAADGGDVVDAASMDARFRRLGYVRVDAARSQAYETEAALRVGRHVKHELQESSRVSRRSRRRR